jgi:hypothetical protein
MILILRDLIASQLEIMILILRGLIASQKNVSKSSCSAIENYGRKIFLSNASMFDYAVS